MSGRIDELRVRGTHRQLVAALRSHGYDVQVHEVPGIMDQRYATVLRKGWMFVGTIAPVGDFGTAELTLFGHNNDTAAMAGVVVTLAEGS